MASTLLFGVILLIARLSSSHDTTLTELCLSGCNVIAANNSSAFHCIDFHQQRSKPILLSSPMHSVSDQCLYHDASFNQSLAENITIMHTYDVDNECTTACLDWYNGCTECLCIDNQTSSICNNKDTCSYIQPHCRASSNELLQYGYAVSMVLWFTVVDIDGDYDIFLPFSLLSDLQSLFTKYISEYTIYDADVQNISCHLLSPENYTTFYSFVQPPDTDSMIDDILRRFLPSPNNHSNFSTTNATNFDLFSTELDNVNHTNPATPNSTFFAWPSRDTVLEHDANYYNYIPQCTVLLDSAQSVFSFITFLRNTSNLILHEILEYYLTHNLSLLFHNISETDEQATSNETLLDYLRDIDHNIFYIDYTNGTFIKLVEDWNESTSISTAYELSFNRSKYSIEFQSLSYYLGNVSTPYEATLSPTPAPTKPSDCWFNGHRIEHAQNFTQDECSTISCFDGSRTIYDKYCGAECYDNHTMYNAYNVSVCCLSCSKDNVDCPQQKSCASCIGSERDCYWLGDHCSAVCTGAYCWNNGECPVVLVMRLLVTGVSLQQVSEHQVLINHAIARTLNITESLIKDYFITQTPEVYKVEVKKSISLTVNDQRRIPDILVNQNQQFVEQLNIQIGIAFQEVPSIRSRIAVAEVEYGGMEGDIRHTSLPSASQDNNEWLDDNSAMILLVCGAMIAFTILALCYRYPMLSYCCCCVPIKVRRKLRNFTRNHCCECCQRFSFGVLYDDDMSDFLKRRREERLRNLQLRNEIMEEQHHLNGDDREEKEVEEEFGGGGYVEHESQGKVTKKRKKKKNKKKRKKKRTMEAQHAVESTHNAVKVELVKVTNSNQMLYHQQENDVIEEEEIL